MWLDKYEWESHLSMDDLKVSELLNSFFWWTVIVFFKALRLETYNFLNCIGILQKGTLLV